MPTPIQDIQTALGLGGTGAIALGGILDSFFGTRGTVDSISNPSKFSSIVLAQHNGLATTNRSMMFITMPKCFRDNQVTAAETKVIPFVEGANQTVNESKNPADLIHDIPFFCSGTTIPGISLETNAYYPYGYGVVEQVPTGQRFDDVDAVFYCDGNGSIYNFFHRWMQNIVNFNATTPMAGGSFKNAYPFEFFYKDEYTATVQIVTYNQASDVVVVHELREAFPAVVSPTSVNWDQDDQIMLLPVTFKYSSWVSNTLFENNMDSAGRSISFTDTLIRVGTATQMLSGLVKKPASIADIVNIVTSATLLKQTTLF